MKFILLFALTGAALFGQHFPLADAHNCYPYKGQWKNRIDRALSVGSPVAIEQDIAWYGGKAVVSHTDKTTGTEPTLREHFFERVRPLMEQALRENHRDQWPLIVVHFDFKDLQAPLLHAVWDVLGEYQDWITAAAKTDDPTRLSPFEMKPLLVLTEDADAQEEVFFRQVPVGGKLRVFGSGHTNMIVPPTNYRRWLNYSWHAVEPEGQPKAGEWTPADAARLKALVDGAHKLGYWIRFYTLDGFVPSEDLGWDAGYNFGSRAAVEVRWKAALDAGVDLIASDQYETLGKFVKDWKR
ncbi:MAG TPA: hypothetical protein VHB50_13305 [Bryobacteraceae bacterium]|nr:hypothetical protein [Bryobacteraceae bacterium]